MPSDIAEGKPYTELSSLKEVYENSEDLQI